MRQDENWETLHSGCMGSGRERNTIWQCEGLMWQPQGEEQVMVSAVVATEKQKRRWLWWINGSKIHMQLQEKECACKKRRNQDSCSEWNFFCGDDTGVARRPKWNNQMPHFRFHDVERLRQGTAVTAWFATDCHHSTGCLHSGWMIVIIGGSLLMGQQKWIDCCAKCCVKSLQ